MPAKNIIKEYRSGGYYHNYNRGVNKADIFLDELDYSTFLSYVKTYLLPKDEKRLLATVSNSKSTLGERENALQLLRLKNYSDKIDLLAYCLMPNHFHLLVKQKDNLDIKFLMQSLMTRYTRYFNKRHKRIGTLFQGTYKAVLIQDDAQLLHLTRYIHLNPFSLKRLNLSRSEQIKLQPSSYPNYVGEIHQAWVKPEFVLRNFAKSGFNSYKSFVEDNDADFEAYRINKISIDEES